MYMVASLLLLSLLCVGLALIWHQRISAFRTMLINIKSLFNGDKIDTSQGPGYGHCASHHWVLDYVVREKESRIGNSIRNFMNRRTLLGIFILGALIWPTIAIVVQFVYRSFALLGVSLVVLIFAIFLIRASDDVIASFGLLSWLRKQGNSELKKDDVAYAEVSLKTLTNWRTTLIIIALLSLIVAPWGELIPQALAFATSGLLITIFSLVYPPVAIVSHRLAVIMVLYVIPLAIALLYLLFGVVNRVSTDLKGEILRNL